MLIICLGVELWLDDLKYDRNVVLAMIIKFEFANELLSTTIRTITLSINMPEKYFTDYSSLRHKKESI